VKSLFIAAGLALLGSGTFVAWTCHAESRDACYIAQGMSPYVAGALLILCWPLVTGVLVIARAWSRPPPKA
jgi:hypothetical protein